jgi:putative oxidoreductase
MARLLFRSPEYYFQGLPAVGVLFLRLFAGSAMIFHGLPKIQSPFNWMGPNAPVPGVLQAFAAFSEFGGGLALIVGLLTPLACFGIMCTMAVAILSHMTNDATPTYFVKSGSAEGDAVELPLAFFTMALTLLLTGPGILSLDAKLFGRRK